MSGPLLQDIFVHTLNGGKLDLFLHKSAAGFWFTGDYMKAGAQIAPPVPFPTAPRSDPKDLLEEILRDFSRALHHEGDAVKTLYNPGNDPLISIDEQNKVLADLRLRATATKN